MLPFSESGSGEGGSDATCDISFESHFRCVSSAVTGTLAAVEAGVLASVVVVVVIVVGVLAVGVLAQP